MEKRVSFYSEGQKLVGVLHIPEGLKLGEKRPVVVICSGYTGVKEGAVSIFARLFAEAGFVSLIFDHRGAGESEGQRGRVVPQEQVEDILNGITFVEQHPEVDKEKLTLFGSSLGGSNACAAAAINPKIKAVSCLNSIGDFRRWMRAGRRYWEWKEFLKKVEEDRVRRVMTGKSRYAHPYEVIPADPATLEYMEERYRTVPGMRVEVPFEIAESFLQFCPEAVVHCISPSAALFIHGEEDVMVSPDESRSLYERAKEPKKLIILPGGTHFGVYQEPFINQIVDLSVEWFQNHLS